MYLDWHLCTLSTGPNSPVLIHYIVVVVFAGFEALPASLPWAWIGFTRFQELRNAWWCIQLRSLWFQKAGNSCACSPGQIGRLTQMMMMMMKIHMPNICCNDKDLHLSRWFAGTRMCQKACQPIHLCFCVLPCLAGCSFDDPQMISQCLLQAAQALGVMCWSECKIIVLWSTPVHLSDPQLVCRRRFDKSHESTFFL